MRNDNTILIKDACILIDLMQLSIFELFLVTGYSIQTTVSVVNEITEKEQQEMLSKAISNNQIICEKDGNLSDILHFQKKYRGISYQDATVLELAKRKGGTLISADGLLRKAGLKEQIKVHGTLWIISELKKLELIENNTAISKVKLLMKINLRISESICKKVIKTFEES